jgi:hypothetical protein
MIPSLSALSATCTTENFNARMHKELFTERMFFEHNQARQTIGAMAAA